MSLTTLKGIIAFIFSFPFVVFMNVLWGFLSFMAAFTVDKSKFPINCELDNLVTVGAGGIKSIGYIASDTAVALRAAEFGVPEFISTPIVPIFFGLVWLVKFSSLKDKSFGLCVIGVVDQFSLRGD
ncbi:hypothetical protein [Vibrio parahaemolyticus]|uniref:hypothetical protein n=1 Tax=Vibrio parahaemolyticus TaxID=670 RepID=UPI002360B3A5|nr:hypothetical protein [Vibrio parahaemolyticus]